MQNAGYGGQTSLKTHLPSVPCSVDFSVLIRRVYAVFVIIEFISRFIDPFFRRRKLRFIMGIAKENRKTVVVNSPHVKYGDEFIESVYSYSMSTVKTECNSLVVSSRESFRIAETKSAYVEVRGTTCFNSKPKKKVFGLQEK